MDGTSETRTPAEIAAVIDFVMDAPIHRHLGLSVIATGPGEARLSFVAGPAAQMAGGKRVHGGVLSLLLEPAAFIALLPLLPRDRDAMTADIHVAIMRRVPPGATVELVGRVLRLGRSLAFCQSDALVNGKMAASARLTKSIVATA